MASALGKITFGGRSGNRTVTASVGTCSLESFVVSVADPMRNVS